MCERLGGLGVRTAGLDRVHRERDRQPIVASAMQAEGEGKRDDYSARGCEWRYQSHRAVRLKSLIHAARTPEAQE